MGRKKRPKIKNDKLSNFVFFLTGILVVLILQADENSIFVDLMRNFHERINFSKNGK